MNKEIQIAVSPEKAFSADNLRAVIAEKTGIPESDFYFRIRKRSIDARGRKVKYVLRVIVSDEGPVPENSFYYDLPDVSSAQPVIIIGAGPAGMFAALKLIERGLKPVIIERGRDVRARRRDLAAINKDHKVNPDSNYCFGEGGAGTYSDGKLYTRSKKRGDVDRILHLLVKHGAPENILVDAHPHIGTNRLPKVVTAINDTIRRHGGEIYFDSRVTDIILKDSEAKGVVTADGSRYEGRAVILATGHSARDIFELLHSKRVLINEKPFALGVRIEHPQEIIDKIQYNCNKRSEFLPAASYSLVTQVNRDSQSRGVFSFCMCPGGFIVPSATEQEEVVVNGMSPSRRDSYYANSGIVVAVEQEELKDFDKAGPLAGVQFQRQVEKKSWEAGGRTQAAPAQKLTDFLAKRASSSLNTTSYQPGLTPADMSEVLPAGIETRLREAFRTFGKKMKGYITEEAQVVAVESRTSSPVSIPRDRDTLEHVQVKRFFPCGEGAGYAGGIMSAALDGARVAEKVGELYGI